MCTLSVIPRPQGYFLAMNRDEKLARVAGLPPQVHWIDGRRVAFPSEPGGGTWIALNEAGVTFALINWYAVAVRVAHNPTSRGAIVRSVGGLTTLADADAILARQPLPRTNPFRLVGVQPRTKEIIEWRWDLNQLTRHPLAWRARQFISSGFDEPQAQRIRHRTFRAAWRQSTAGSLAWLRRLHRSHRPEQGPFSTCMHRSDAATVSYSEVVVWSRRPIFRYWAGAPCCVEKAATVRL